MKYKKQVRFDCNCFCYWKIPLFKTKKFKRGSKLPTKDFYLRTDLSFTTHRAQPLAAISTEKLFIPLYFVFLNTAAATWIYVFQQKEWMNMCMLWEKHNHILKEKSKQRANLIQRFSLPYPWNRCGYLKDRNAKCILLPREQFPLAILSLPPATKHTFF